MNLIRFLYLIVTSLMSFGLVHAQEQSSKAWKDKPIELGLGATMGNAYSRNWQFNYGGAASIDFVVAKYFSLGFLLNIETLTLTPVYRDEAIRLNNQRVFSMIPMVASKFLIPIEMSSSTLIPFVRVAGGCGVNIRESMAGLGIKTAIGAGVKFLFADNWGVSLDYGHAIDLGFSKQFSIENSLSGNLSLIYRL